ncbi:homoserine kinase [Flaviflexus equikiangi]|uniref:Homoserine kinase n=1 Tax=Flaviflexus equikiangi TaxID=2758573 RepID=A0ABS2TFQ8_9ACTO|nr:homoserine kinase [Flaviflexus equikiangi]MBM9433493.1 homoserine kinase [Flaviflexus equikiangi]
MRQVVETLRVRVPATSGNLGPGFDSLGLAHGIYDEVEATLIAGPSTVEILGEGQGELPTDDSHLIVRAMQRGFEFVGMPQAGVKMTCRNSISQSRGLGSSAAAVVAGLTLAAGFAGRPDVFGKAEVLTLATEFEGHPDNAAPAVYGGAVVSWAESGQAHAASLDLHKDLRTTLLVPHEILATSTARAALPVSVPHVDAAFNAARTALLVHALAKDLDLLHEATRDRLHQEYRSSAMPATAEVLDALRSAGWPAVVSGAGPAILVLDELDPQTCRILESRGFAVTTPGIGRGAHIID